MTFELRLSRGQQYSSDQPGSNSDERLFLREISTHVSEAAAQAELISLTRERDSELLGAALRRFAGRQETRGRSDVAAAIYERMAASPAAYGAAESRLAGERLEALRGRGKFGARAEIFVQNFAQSVTDPANLAGMALAGGVFQGLRVATYARLLASPTANIVTRGLGARGLSWGLALLAEAPAFSLGTRSTNALMGRSQDWSARALGHELAASYLTLGALRVSGAGGELLFRRLSPAGGLLSRGFVQQASMLTGITAATWLEQQTGLRERTDGATLLASSLASLVHFNVAGRILHGLGNDALTQRLRFQQERLESLPPPSLEATARAWTLAGRTPVLVGADSVFMSSIDGSPSTPPPPAVSGGESRARRSSAPPPATRDPVEDFTTIEQTIAPLYDGRTPGLPWIGESRQMIELYNKVVEAMPVAHQPSNHPNILKYLHDLASEANNIHSLLTLARSFENHPALDAPQHSVGQFLEYFFRSANTSINYLKGLEGVTIPEPLRHLRTARFWLQYGIEKAAGEQPLVTHPEGFPYYRGEDGYYVIPEPARHVIIMGDERAPRTFDLVNGGHRVTHVEFDNSRMRITQKLMDVKVQRAKDSGQWRIELPNGNVRYHSSIQNAEPADYVEAYFPELFNVLKPRFDPGRMEQLRELIASNLAIRLNPDGSAFVISDRHDAIEDLAKAVQQSPGIELLELQIIRDRMPLRAGMHVTAVPGENLYSWLVLRKRSE